MQTMKQECIIQFMKLDINQRVCVQIQGIQERVSIVDKVKLLFQYLLVRVFFLYSLQLG